MSPKKGIWIILSALIIASLGLASCAPQPAAQPPAQATEAPVVESTEAPAAPTEAPAAAVTEAPAPTEAPTAEPPKEEKKVLRVRMNGDIGNLDPAFIVGSDDDTVDRAVMEGLIYYPPNSTEWKPLLAEKIEQSEDGLEIYFKLREGIQWQKGYGELTTEDVKFSFERFRDPELKAAYADDFISLDRVEIINKYEGKVILKEPQATMWTTTLPLTSGLIVCKKFVEEVGLEKFKNEVVGTGPYIFVEWKPKEKVILQRNPDYWGEAPYWDEIQLFAIDDDKAAEVALEAGELDFARVSLAGADRFASDPNFGQQTVVSNSYSWIGINVENPKLQDVNVRQAIRYAIDVPSILEATYVGKAERANAMLPKSVLGYWEDAPVYERDVEKAKEFLAAAGLDSLDLKIQINDTSEYRTWAEIAQANLAEAGINLEIEPLDSSAFWEIGAGDKGKDVELFSMTYSAMPDPAWFTMWFTCDQVGVWNWMRWCSPEYDELHKEGIRTTDPAKRAEIYIQMQKLMDESVSMIWITDQPIAYAYSSKIVPVIAPGGVIAVVHAFQPAP